VADLAGAFDLIVVATGAGYRLGLGRFVLGLLETGWGKSPLARRLFRSARLKNWFYYRARRSVLPKLGKLDANRITIIGDAAAPGKTREAVESAFKAALFGLR